MLRARNNWCVVLLARTHDLPQRPALAILLSRVASARNMRRFYRINILPDLFCRVGGWHHRPIRTECSL